MATSIIKDFPTLNLLEVKSGTVTISANGYTDVAINYDRTYSEAYPVVMQSTTGSQWQYITTAIARRSNSGCYAEFHNLSNASVTIGYQVLVFGN